MNHTLLVAGAAVVYLFALVLFAVYARQNSQGARRGR